MGQAVPVFTDGNPPQTAADWRFKNAFTINEDQAEAGVRSIFTYLPGGEAIATAGVALSRKDF